MIPYIWAIDTPWAKKGTEYKLCNHVWAGLYVNECSHGEPKQCSVQDLINIGWIKPIENDGVKKLTEEEILEAITTTSRSSTGIVVSSFSIYKLSKLLAEHL